MRESAFSLKDLQNASVAVLGFGRAGRAVTDYLLSHGCVPTVYAAGGVPEAQKGNYPHNGVSFCDKFPEEFAEDVLFRSPGIRPDHAAIRRAVAKGATLTGEVDWFLSHTRARVIGVTGSDGKTTTANLITALLREAGHRAVLGGNNGDALLPHLDTLLAEDFAVVELSSFQLMTAPAPDVAVLTNLTPNHLNWHTDFWEYAAAKCRILAGCSRFVTDAECAHSRAVGARTRVPVAWCACAPPLPITPKAGDVFLHTAGDELVLSDGEKEVRMPAFAAYRLPGAHNRKDLLLAYGAVYPFVDTGALVRVAQTFRGVAHRMQTVGCVSGVTYIDSSIDTSPTRTAATLAALACFDHFIALKINEDKYRSVMSRHAGRKADFDRKYDMYGKCTVAELEEKLLTMKKTEIAGELGCSRMTLYRIINNIAERNPAKDTSIWHYTS